MLLTCVAITLLAASAKSVDISMDRTPIAMAAVPGGVIVCGEYFKDGGDTDDFEEGYWIWRMDADGNQVWTRDFVSEDQEAPVALVAASDGVQLMGERFINGSGYQSFMKSVKGDGAIGEQVNVTAPGIPRTMLALADGTFVIAGGSDEAPEKKGKDDADYDAWLLCVKSDGAIVWQKWLDKGNDEGVYALTTGTNGTIYCLANSGKLDKFGSGPSIVWLFEYNVDGNVVRETTLPEGSFIVKGGNGLLVRQGEKLLASISLPQSAISKDVKRDEFSFPARFASFTTSLDLQWTVDYVENHGVSTPKIAPTDSGFVLASAGAKTPLLTILTPQGELGKTIKGEKWSFTPMSQAESVVVNDGKAYVAGSVSDFMSDDDDGDKTFVTCFDVNTQKVLWQNTY